MAKPRNKTADYIAYLALRLMVTLLHAFSTRNTYPVARTLADLVWRFGGRYRSRAMDHLRASFPDWPERRLASVVRESMRSFGYLTLEVFLTGRLITPYSWRRHVRLADTGELIRLLLERRTGMIFVTGHVGNFEVVGYTMATLGFPSIAVARPIDNPYINDWLMGVREKTGQGILYKKGATRSMDDILEARGALSFIADQDAGRKGVFVNFFGRPASTTKTPALMAMRYDAPIVVGYGRRLGDDYRFELAVERIIRPEEWRNRDDPMTWITQEYTLALEAIVRRKPEQYFWVHRRWKHQPE